MIKIIIVYDNIASKGFIAGWGFSAVIEKNKELILFDSGWNGYALLHNLEKAQIDVKKISKIIISHKHWDHLGGLDSVLNNSNNPTVFVPSSFSSKLKAEITAFGDLREIVEDFQEVSPGIYTTPQLSTEIDDLKEISLIIETSKGSVIVCGCSHPGLDKIMQYAKQKGKIHAVIGGFHGFEKIDQLQNVDMIIPCHCTRKKKEILETYPEKSRECYSGVILTFD